MADTNSEVFKRGNKTGYSIRPYFGEKNIRLSSLSSQYREDALRRRIEEEQAFFLRKTRDEREKQKDNATSTVHFDTAEIELPPNLVETITQVYTEKPEQKLGLLINIEKSVKAQENAGYKAWARNYNMTQTADTLVILQKHKIANFDALKSLMDSKSTKLQSIKADIDTLSDTLKSISVLQKHIGAYSKGKDVYKEYKRSKTPDQFREQHSEKIERYEAAKSHFDEQGYVFGGEKKLPSIKELREQYATVNAEKSTLWSQYQSLKNEDKELYTAYQNAKIILNIKDDKLPKEQSDQEQIKKQRKNHER